ncbi:hypothetical protein PYCCODRAFT_1391245 [Trametes coccinea BRFM310]|uniref:ARM repeat-containing protein n=1 Tax=Trametes coccinea (strain BRFM310) TaxID=1353009 RepID=A0A1Y2IKV4_TRAC3|nr:hypothetical protein PYCCODRAFT_1391245 [Trametes coccinea BRFM310]
MEDKAGLFDNSTLVELRVPREFSLKLGDDAEAETIRDLELWKQKTCKALSNLRKQLRCRQTIPLQAAAQVIYHTASFDGDGPWVVDRSRAIAREILSEYANPSVDVLERVLRNFVKPIFSLNPHPGLNVDTGRKLPRPAGGPSGGLDHLEGQEWKSHPELFSVLSWCLRQSNERAVEKLWHLFVPPLMTYLDDHQVPYKLQGVYLASELLRHAPPDLLRRTGVDVLLSTSLKTCLTFLHDPETPGLIRATVSAYLRLTQSTTTDGSAARFDQLCGLLGDSIIGNVWVYAYREPSVIEASVDCIPAVVTLLDIGTVRYLKALIPQLVFPLIPAPENGASIGYKMSSARALSVVVRVCAPRIHNWRGTILEGVLKCWVELADRKGDNEETSQLRDHLRHICTELLNACRASAPQVIAELQSIQRLDSLLFEPLLSNSFEPGQ